MKRELGFEMTILGMAAFVAGAVLAGQIDRHQALPQRAGRRAGGVTGSNGWAGARSFFRRYR